MKHNIFNYVVLLLLVGTYLNNCLTLRNRHTADVPEKTVKLTFDDGPNAYNNVTESVLDMLKRHNIKGYFCLIGMNVERHPDIVKRIYDEGHYIVNHGYHDEFVLHKKKSDIERDINKCNIAIGKALGIKDYCTKYYRPPYGLYRPSTRKIWKKFGMEILPFTFYTLDAQRNRDGADKVIKETINSIKKHNGGILVLHDGRDREDKMLAEIAKDSTTSYDRSWIPDALDAIITALIKEGYVFK